MSQEIEFKIEQEKQRAKRAQQAMDVYLGEFIESRKEAIYQAFLACDPRQTDELTRLKFAHAAITDMEIAIQSDIDTGTKLVPKKLTDEVLND